MSVLANSNKQILWEVLNGLISENKLKINNIEDFRSFFEHKCKEYHVKRFDYSGLSDINKHIVSECFEYLKKASQESKLLMFREYEQYGNKNILNNLQIGKRYEEHQTNFKTMINAKRPNEVDFTENTDIPIGNMDDAMSKMMKERDSDLNTITNEYNQNHDSIKWLNNSGDIPPPKLNIHDNKLKPILKSNASVNNTQSNIEFIIGYKKDKNNENKTKNENENENEKIENKNEKIENKNEKIENKKIEKKRVKFKSDFLDNIDNVKNTNENNEKRYDKDLKERARQFQDLTEEMNKKDEDNSRIYQEKRDIIGIMDDKDKKPIKKETNLENVFTKMKRKTKKSDIEGSMKVDLIDVNVKIDKLEIYLVDILKNQIDLMNQQKEIISKLQYNENSRYDKLESTFSAI